MIDFSKITKTIDGYDCHYFGTREHNGTTLHCFGIMHPHFGVKEAAYNAEGKRLRWDGFCWIASESGEFKIVKPKKKVSVTRWFMIERDVDCVDGYYVKMLAYRPESQPEAIDIQHTFTFEVDE